MSAERVRASATARSKATDLERVRNNQRRCRARRKEYVTQLESMLHEYESAGIQASVDTNLQRLTRENESLKRLLLSLGLGPEFLNTYKEATHAAPSVSRTTLSAESCCQTGGCSSSPLNLDDAQAASIPSIVGELPTPTLLPLSDTDIGSKDHDPLSFFDSSIEMDATRSWPQAFPFPIDPISPVDLSQDGIQTKAEASQRPLSEERISDTTTLCSLAFSLVLMNNLKGYSAEELDLRLRMGYRSGTTLSEGCRVDNKVLIKVLADIS